MTYDVGYGNAGRNKPYNKMHDVSGEKRLPAGGVYEEFGGSADWTAMISMDNMKHPDTFIYPCGKSGTEIWSAVVDPCATCNAVKPRHDYRSAADECMEYYSYYEPGKHKSYDKYKKDRAIQYGKMGGKGRPLV